MSKKNYQKTMNEIKTVNDKTHLSISVLMVIQKMRLTLFDLPVLAIFAHTDSLGLSNGAENLDDFRKYYKKTMSTTISQ